jgi:hypothetical protein
MGRVQITLERSYEEDFYPAQDGETLAVDFWSYLNALQARLGWTKLDDRVWDYLEELERDLEPLLEALPGEPSLPYLSRMVARWAAGDAAGERDALRTQVANMLIRALDAQDSLARVDPA